jgi:ferredoxin
MPPIARTAASTTHNAMQREHTVRLLFPDDTEAAVRVREDEPVLLAALHHGIRLPSMCLQGWCLTCAARVCGRGEWDASRARRYYEADRDAGFILLCTARPQSELTVLTHQRIEMREHRRRLGLPAPEGGVE